MHIGAWADTDCQTLEGRYLRIPHPVIIDRETFELAQELRQHHHRPTKSDIVSMFSGLLYCEDCGEKLYYSVTNNYKREQAYVQSYEKLFAEKQLEDFDKQKKTELAEKRREQNKAIRRIRDIDNVIQKLYEDNVADKINDERFATMSLSLETEQNSLKAEVPILEAELETLKLQTKAYRDLLSVLKR